MAIESKNLLVWVKAMSRGQALPLDASEVWESYAEAESYAKGINDTTVAYIGQTLKVKNGSSVDVYVISDASGTLLKIADEEALGAAIGEVSDKIPEVVDNLTTNDSTKALSAAQGKALDDAIKLITTDLGNLGAGDMLKVVYDKNDNGAVDNADNAYKLEGHEASYFATAAALAEKAEADHDHTISANAADDDVIILTGSSGTNAVSYTASHAKPESLTSGTYKSVTVNEYGHVTSGSNPETLADFGITDAYTKTEIDAKVDEITESIPTVNYPVTSVNEKTGAVVLTAQDVGALPDTTVIPSIAGLASTESVSKLITEHNVAEAAHEDIRSLISELTTKLTNFLDVDEETTDQLSEVLTLINNNKGTLDSITTNKINVSDIVDNLTTASTTKVLSANQGVAIKALIEALQAADAQLSAAIADVSSKIPTVNYPVTSVNNKTGAVNLTAEDVGALPADTKIPSIEGLATESFVTKKITEAQLAGEEVDLSGYATKDELPTAVSQLTNDAGFISEIPAEYVTENELEAKGYLTEHQSLAGLATEQYVTSQIAAGLTDYAKLTDLPDVSEFIKEIPAEYVTETELTNKGYLTEHQDLSNYVTSDSLAEQLATKVDTTRKINNKALSADITLTAADVGALPSDTQIPSIEGLATEGYVDAKVAGIDLSEYAKTSDIPDTSAFITLADIPDEYVTETELSNKGYLTEHQDLSDYAKSADIAAQLEAKVDATRKINDKVLSSDIELTAADVHALPDTTMIPSIDGLASEDFVKSEIASIGIADYAKSADVVEQLANLKTELSENIVSESNEWKVTDEAGNIIFEVDKDGANTTALTLDGKPVATEDFVATAIKDIEIPSIDGLASEDFVKSEIARAQLEGEEVDLSGYATKDDIKNFITVVPDEYITENELDAKGYLTAHQDISHLVANDKLAEELAKKVDNTRTINGKALSADITLTAHDVSALPADTNIPSIEGLASAEYVNAQIAAVTEKIPTVSYPVTSVNEKVGAVVLTAEDVHALPDTTVIPSIEGLVKDEDFIGHTHTISANGSGDDAITLVGTSGANEVSYRATHTKPNTLTAGTYKSVTVNEYGHITAGTNPTKVADFGITDVYTKSDVYTKAEVDAELADKAAKEHAHTVTDITGLTATVDELNFVDGVTYNIQLQLDGKANKATTLEGYGITDAASKAYVEELIEGMTTEGTADAALVQAALSAHTNDKANPHGVTLAQLGVTATDVELNCLGGITSNVQNQLNKKANATHEHEQYLTANDIKNKTDKDYVDAALAAKADSEHEHAQYLVESDVNRSLEALKTELSENIVSESNAWTVVDDNGNIIAKVDESGLETTEVNAKSVKVNGVDVVTSFNAKLSEHDNDEDAHSSLFDNLQQEISKINRAIADLQYEPIAFTSFTNNKNTVELGTEIASVDLAWAYNKQPKTLTISGITVNGAIVNDYAVSTETTSYKDTLSLKPTAVTTKKYTIKATDDREASASKETSITFVNGVYYGVIAENTTINSAAVLKMTKKLQNSRNMTVTITPSASEYIAFALPTRLGTPTFKMGGFETTCNCIEIQFTNASGYTEAYNVYTTTNTGLGKTEVVVT